MVMKTNNFTEYSRDPSVPSPSPPPPSSLPLPSTEAAVPTKRVAKITKQEMNRGCVAYSSA